MRARLALVAAVALTAAAFCVAGPDEVRVFQVRFRPVGDAPGLVEPLLSPGGSILLHPNLKTLTVRDERAVLDKVAKALDAWDLPPAAYRVRLRVLLASTASPTPGSPAPVVPGLGVDLARLFRYSSFEEVDSLVVTAAEGSPVEAAVGDRYNVRFTLRAGRLDPERLVLSQLEFSRRQKGETGAEVLEPLLRSTVSLKLGQTAVVGAARSESATRALLLVLWAQREDEP